MNTKKTPQEQALEYCKEICRQHCSANPENCNAHVDFPCPGHYPYNAFLAGYKAAQDVEADLKFIIEIINDLKHNGYQQGGMAATMLKDWRNELQERVKNTEL